MFITEHSEHHWNWAACFQSYEDEEMAKDSKNEIKEPVKKTVTFKLTKQIYGSESIVTKKSRRDTKNTEETFIVA